VWIGGLPFDGGIRPLVGAGPAAWFGCGTVEHMKKSLDPRARKSPEAGFTVVELMIVIAIAAILALVGVPSLQRVMDNLRQGSASNLVINDLNMARGEAIKRNESVLVCARNTAGTDCQSTAAWSQGWIVCVMRRGSGGAPTNTCADSTELAPNPILVRPALNANLTLTASGSAPVRFLANSARESTSSGSLSLAGSWSGATTRSICVANTGNISRKEGACP